jgi:hypothetical protein
MFLVPDEEWQKYVPPNLQKEVLCRSCYNRMKKLFPHGWRQKKNPVWGEGKEYAGWPNKATWNVMLWLNGDQRLYNLYSRRAAKEKFTPKDAEIFVKSIFPLGTPDFSDGPLSYRVVDWERIAETLNEV